MTTEIVILKAGIATTVQDLGRKGYLAFGVPHSGALDPQSLALANAVTGNPDNVAGLEMLYSGVAVEMRGGPARIAIAGAEATIDAPGKAARRVPAWESCVVNTGERLRVGAIRESAAAYLAVEGGFDIAPVMGSLSTHARGGIGGWRGRALEVGDALPLTQARAEMRAERKLAALPRFASPATLRVILGPHETHFEKASVQAFLRSDYTVSTQTDRSGARLEGPRLRHAGGYDLPSEGVPPGSIQVPGTGLPVVLLADHPTVGGYPRIATIISADLAAAGRLRIGARVRFIAVSTEEAARARSEHDRRYAELAGSIAQVEG